MRYLFTILYLLLSYAGLNAQNKQATYIGAHNEFIVIKGDSIRYCITNRGGFITYRIGKGVLAQIGANKYSLIQNSNRDLLNQSSKVKVKTCDDERINFSFRDRAGSEVVFAYVELTCPEIELNDNTDLKTYHYKTSISGEIEIPKKDSEILKNKEIIVRLTLLGYYLEKAVSLKAGYCYEFIHCQPGTKSYDNFIAKYPMTFVFENDTIRRIDSDGKVLNVLSKQKKQLPFNDSIFWTEGLFSKE